MDSSTAAGESAPVIRVGRIAIPIDTAAAWVRDYANAATNRESAEPFAFPAYDHYATSTDADTISDADLLAPVLLNVDVSLRSYYGLQRLAPLLSARLAHVPREQLADASEEEVADSVGPLYALLDDAKTRVPGVQGTTLSKILHRKRPEFLVLHDKWVRRCYLGGARVPEVRERTWAEYMVLVSTAIRADLADQREAFDGLGAQLPAEAQPSHVRLLDILAWRSQGSQDRVDASCDRSAPVDVVP